MSRDPFTQPAIEFEKKHNVSDIAGRYKFPEGVTSESIEQMTEEFIHASIYEGKERKKYTKQFGQSIGNAELTLEEVKANKNMTQAFEGFLEDLEHQAHTKMLGELEKLNPEIKKIRFNRAKGGNIDDVLDGIASGFNHADIDHYLNFTKDAGVKNPIEYRATESFAKLRELEAKIGERLEGVRSQKVLGWDASKSTLEKIWEQVKDRPVQAAVEIEKDIGKLR